MLVAWGSVWDRFPFKDQTCIPECFGGIGVEDFRLAKIVHIAVKIVNPNILER